MVSMSIIKKQVYDTKIILKTFLDIFEKHYSNYINNKESFFDELQSKVYMINEKIRIQLHNSNILEGKLKGIDKTGALILLDSQNNIKNIYSGRIIKN